MAPLSTSTDDHHEELGGSAADFEIEAQLREDLISLSQFRRQPNLSQERFAKKSGSKLASPAFSVPQDAVPFDLKPTEPVKNGGSEKRKSNFEDGSQHKKKRKAREIYGTYKIDAEQQECEAVFRRDHLISWSYPDIYIHTCTCGTGLPAVLYKTMVLAGSISRTPCLQPVY